MTTEQLRLRAAPTPVRLSVPASGGAALVVVAGALVIAVVVGRETWAYRPLFAAIILLNLLAVSVKWPRLGVVLTFVYLPVMALARRLLIEPSGWITADPLLIVGPLVGLFLAYRVIVAGRRSLTEDTMSKLVLALLALALIESVNPSGNGFVAGLLGLLFIAAPLLWFFVGHALGTPKLAKTVVYAGVAMATLVAGYGLWQTQIGFPSWDSAWVKLGGYQSLKVGGIDPLFGTSEVATRAFGTFASAREYGAYLDIGFVFAVALALHRRWLAALALPFLGWAIVLSSGRSTLVLALLGVVLLLGMRTRSWSGILVTLVLGIVLLFAAVSVFGSALDRAAGQSNNPLVAHQVGGLLDPLDPQKSTLLGHLDLVKQGFIDGVKNPIGRGTGETNRAAQLAGDSNLSSEVDVSDAFISLGLAGGLLFLAIIVLAFRRVIRAYFSRGDPALLATAGLFVVMLGQWMNGGLYAASPLTWFMLGWVACVPLSAPARAVPPTSRRLASRVPRLGAPG